MMVLLFILVAAQVALLVTLVHHQYRLKEWTKVVSDLLAELKRLER